MIVFGWVVFEQSKLKDACSQQLVAVASKVFLKLSGLMSQICSRQADRKNGVAEFITDAQLLNRRRADSALFMGAPKGN